MPGLENQVLAHRHRQCFKNTGQFPVAVAGLLLLLISGSAAAADEQWFSLRNQNPFLQIYGLPPFQTATLANDGEVKYSIALDIANHADSGETQGETVVLDGECNFLTLSLRHGVTQWLEVGFDLPVVGHSDGIFDNAIDRWHKIWGISNSKRTGQSNQLQFLYARQGTAPYELSSPGWGVGDLQLTAAVPLWRAHDSDDRTVSLRSSLKLPTGDEETLRGSGAFDFSLGLYASDTGIFAQQDLSLSGFAGILLLGKGKVFPVIQQRAVGFGGFAAAWQVTDKFSVATQFYVQGAYLDSELDEIGGSSVQAAFGGTYHIPRHRISLSFALVEDIFSDATTDVALHVSVRGYSGK